MLELGTKKEPPFLSPLVSACIAISFLLCAKTVTGKDKDREERGERRLPLGIWSSLDPHHQHLRQMPPCLRAVAVPACPQVWGPDLQPLGAVL